MILATDTQDYANGQHGMVELALIYLNDKTKRLFSRGEIITFLNVAQSYVASKINALHREYFLSSSLTPVVANQAYYSFPEDIVKLWSIEVLSSTTDTEGKGLVEIPMEDREFFEQLDTINAKEDAATYFVAGTTFKMMPMFGSASTQQIRVHHVKRLAPLVNAGDESEIPKDHHGLLPTHAARQGWAKLNRVNAGMEKLWAEGMDALESSIKQFAPNRQTRIRPFYGSFGPGKNIRVR